MFFQGVGRSGLRNLIPVPQPSPPSSIAPRRLLSHPLPLIFQCSIVSQLRFPVVDSKHRDATAPARPVCLPLPLLLLLRPTAHRFLLGTVSFCSEPIQTSLASLGIFEASMDLTLPPSPLTSPVNIRVCFAAFFSISYCPWCRLRHNDDLAPLETMNVNVSLCVYRSDTQRGARVLSVCSATRERFVFCYAC